MDMPTNNDLPRVSRKLKVEGVVAVVIAVGTLVVMSQAHVIVSRMPQTAAVIASVLVELTNVDRSAQGLATLSVSPLLNEVAQAKANDMAQKGYFAHVSPEGLTPWHWFKEKGYRFTYAGENLAVDFYESSDVQRAWMLSPTHRANIVGTQFTEIGIATADGMYKGRPATFVVQVFGTPVPVQKAVATGPSRATSTEPTVRPVVLPETPQAAEPALATTLAPTVTVTPTTVLGESAGSYLASTPRAPWWFTFLNLLVK